MASHRHAWLVVTTFALAAGSLSAGCGQSNEPAPRSAPTKQAADDEDDAKAEAKTKKQSDADAAARAAKEQEEASAAAQAAAQSTTTPSDTTVSDSEADSTDPTTQAANVVQTLANGSSQLEVSKLNPTQLSQLTKLLGSQSGNPAAAGVLDQSGKMVDLGALQGLLGAGGNTANGGLAGFDSLSELLQGAGQN